MRVRSLIGLHNAHHFATSKPVLRLPGWLCGSTFDFRVLFGMERIFCMGIVRLDSSATVWVRNFGGIRVALVDDHQEYKEIVPELKGSEQWQSD